MCLNSHRHWLILRFKCAFLLLFPKFRDIPHYTVNSIFMDWIPWFLIAELIGPYYLSWIDTFSHRQNKHLLIIENTQILTRRLNGINECGINIVSNICPLQLIILLQQKKCLIGWSIHCLITGHVAVSIENLNGLYLLYLLLVSLCSAY